MEMNLDFFIQELKLQEKAENTLSKYKADITRFLEFITHDRDISKEDVIGYKAFATKKYKPRSVNSYIVAVNKYMKWSGCEDLKVKKLKMQEEYSIENVLSDADYGRMLRWSKKLDFPEMYMIIKTIKQTGVRISELLDFFTVESVKAGFYIPLRNKGKCRDAVMPQKLARELRKYCKDNHIDSGPIFTINKSTIWRRLQRIAGKARVNLDRAHAHSLRHLFGKDYIRDCNNDVVGLADILGHNDLKTTRIYTRSTLEEKRKKLESIK